MAGIDFLDENKFLALVRRLERLERAASTGFTNVSRGALRITSTEGLIVDGSEKVTGTLDVTGTLHIEGTLNADGTITLTGPVTITGATALDGPVTITGTTSLESDLTVNGAGVIHVGPITLSPSGHSGSGTISTPLGLYLDANNVITGDQLTVGTDAFISGTLHNFGMPSKLGATPNVYIDGTGKFWRTS